MIEFLITAAIIWLGLCLWAMDAIETRRWRRASR